MRGAEPRTQIRDAARKLKVSEAELLATTVGQTATRLRDGDDAARAIMRRVLELGEITALTRNENGVIEVTGVPKKFTPPASAAASAPVAAATPADVERDRERAQRQRNFVGGYVGAPIDMRFGFDKWATAFAVVQPGREGKLSRSLQFFDATGTAVHKVYLRNDAGVAAFDKLVADFRHGNQTQPLKVAAAPAAKPDKADSAVDVKELQLAWTEIKDVHQFGRLLTEFGVSREQALRLAPAGLAERIPASAVRNLLDGVATGQIGFMAFVGNNVNTQIFTGKIQKTGASGEWYNVLDPAFNLHLRESAFRRGWVGAARRHPLGRVLRRRRQPGGDLLRPARRGPAAARRLEQPAQEPAARRVTADQGDAPHGPALRA